MASTSSLRGKGNKSPKKNNKGKQKSQKIFLQKLEQEASKASQSSQSLSCNATKNTLGVLCVNQQVLSITYPDGRTISFDYDPTGHLNHVTQSYGPGASIILSWEDGQWIDAVSKTVSPGGIQDIQVDTKGNTIYKLNCNGVPVQQINSPDGNSSTINLRTGTITRFFVNDTWSVQEIDYPDGGTRRFVSDEKGSTTLFLEMSNPTGEQKPPLPVESYTTSADGSCGYFYTDPKGQPIEADLDPQGRVIYEGPARAVAAQPAQTR